MKDWRRVCPETGHQSKGKKKKKKSATTDSGRIPFSFGRPRSLSSGGFFFLSSACLTPLVSSPSKYIAAVSSSSASQPF
jgi:hypothetical protein